jgi:hypothetical protein
MQSSPFKISEINLENIQFKNIKESKNRKIIFIKYKENKKIKNFVFQLPTLLNNMSIEDNEVEIIIDTKNKNKNKKVIEFFKNIDNYIINSAKENNDIWFNHIEDKTDVQYNHTIRQLEDNETLKFKMINSNEFKTNILLNGEIPIDLDEIPDNGDLQCVLELYAVWISDNKFGIILRPVILSFKPDLSQEYNYRLLTDNSDNSLNDEESINELNDDDNNNDDNIFISILNNNDNIGRTEDIISTTTSDLTESNIKKILF